MTVIVVVVVFLRVFLFCFSFFLLEYNYMFFCWCLQYTQPLTSHSPPDSSMLTTTTKSWRSDTLIILPGWECHTGGSRSKPTVHRCSQSGRRLWVARQVHNHEPNGSAAMQQETVHQCQHFSSFFSFASKEGIRFPNPALSIIPGLSNKPLKVWLSDFFFVSEGWEGEVEFFF